MKPDVQAVFLVVQIRLKAKPTSLNFFFFIILYSLLLAFGRQSCRSSLLSQVAVEMEVWCWSQSAQFQDVEGKFTDRKPGCRLQ